MRLPDRSLRTAWLPGLVVGLSACTGIADLGQPGPLAETTGVHAPPPPPPQALRTGKEMVGFSLLAANNPALAADVVATLTGTAATLTVPHGTPLTRLTPTIVHTGARIAPETGVAQDFTNPLPYLVTAADGSAKAWAVTVRVEQSSAKELTRFSVLGLDATVAGQSVTLTLPARTSLVGLAPTVLHTGASVSPASGAPQDFSTPRPYTVTAEDGSTRTFTATVTVEPTPPSSGPDALDLTQVTVYNSPSDVAAWPITTTLSKLEMRSPDVGLSFEFPALATWPDYTPPGWDGPLQYTVWAVVKVGGQWYTSGFIQMWNGRASTGAPLLTDFAINWAYDGRWGPMMGHVPVVGEQMGFFVTAGNARGESAVTSLRERSNVVMVPLPAGDNGVFIF